MARHRKVIVPPSNDTKDKVATIKDVKLSSSKRLNLFLYVSLILIAGVCLLILLPNPIDPIAIEFENYECKGFASNEDLEKAVRLFEGELIGPEGFAVDGDGNMYTGLNDGRIIKFNDTSFTTVIRLGSPPYDNCGALSEESRCGRALGLEINPKEPYLLYIADCYHGISTLDLKTGERVTLVNSSSLPPNIPPMKFVNDMVVLDNGSIFFTDSSSKFSRDMLLMEVYEGRPNGKLVHYNPVDRSLSVVLPKLHFANGLSQSPNDEFLLIVETTRARILRYYLKGPKVGQLDIFIDKLPGMPDNISPSSSGGYWVGFAVTRESGISDFLGRYPLLRTIIVKLGLSHALVHMVPKNGMIMELDQKGKIVHEFYDMGGDSIIGVSEVLDMGGDTLYLGSYETPYIGKFKLT